MCPQFVASCWPLLCLDHSPDNRVNNSHGENNLTNRPERVHPLDRVRGDALLRDAGEARPARRLGSLDLEGGGRLGPGILGILRVLHLKLTVLGEYADKLLVVVLTKRASRLPRNSSAAASSDKMRRVVSSLCIWLMYHFKVYPFSGS